MYANDIQQQTDSIVYIVRVAYPGSMLICHLGKHVSQNKRYQAKRFSCAGLIIQRISNAGFSKSL